MSFTEFPIPSVELVSVAADARSAINAMENTNTAVNTAIATNAPNTIAALDTSNSLWNWIVGKIGAITSIAAGGAWSFGGKVLVGAAQATSAKLTVTDNTSDDAVRITQTGSGNALVVEDSTNPDSTPFVINQGGQAYIGHTTSLPSGEAWPLQVTGTSAVGCVLARFANDVSGSHALSFVKSRSGTNGSYGGIVQDGDFIGRLAFGADDGVTRQQAAAMVVSVDGTPQAGSVPARVLFSTTAAGSATPTERMRITSGGKVGVGTTAPVSKLHVSDGSVDAAVTITQAGAGNALVIEDSTTPDTTPFVIGNDGTVTTYASIRQNTFFDTTSSNGFAGQKARGSATSPLPIVSGDNMLTLVGRGYDGKIFKDAGYIAISSDGVPNTPATAILNATEYRINTVGTTNFTTFGAANNNVGTIFTANRNGTAGDGDGTAIRTAGDMPGKINFFTAPNEGGGPSERMRISNSGNVGINTTSTPYQLNILNKVSTDNNSVATILIGTDTNNGATIDTVRGANNNTHGLAISTSNGGAPTEKVRIQPSGNVGIGTTSINSKLHINGDLSLSSATTSTTAIAGVNGDVPAQVVGYIQVNINGTSRKIPYYA